jgi:signal transduction histidine kinase
MLIESYPAVTADSRNAEVERLADEQAVLRRRLVTDADAVRRQVVRDLHDGTQQRLVQAIITLKLAVRALRANDASAEGLVCDALEQAQNANVELRELAHGILPQVLIRGGLRAGVEAVVDRLDLPVQVHVSSERFATEIEASAYFIVAEALTNVVKHGNASRAEVTTAADGDTLVVEIRDDGIGGADVEGDGLLGLRDRSTALGGRLSIKSPPGEGTVLTAVLPLRAPGPSPAACRGPESRA